MKKILYKNRRKKGLLLIGVLSLSISCGKKNEIEEIMILEYRKSTDQKISEFAKKLYKKNEDLKIISPEMKKFKAESLKIIIDGKKENREKISSSKFIKIKNNEDEKQQLTTVQLKKKNTETENGKKNYYENKNLRRIGENIQSYELYWPVNSRIITGEFGIRNHPILQEEKFHRGVDIAVKEGEEIISGIDGIVTYAGEKGSYGNLIEIQRIDGLKVRYAHLSKVNVEAGQRIAAGEKIGEAGSTGMSTGTHLHYEILIEEIPVNPMRFKYLN